MTDVARLVADHLDIWTAATERRGAGRGGGKRVGFYGVERLRALILDLAVRGRLVPQDAGDEPAEELLKRIAKARDEAGTRSKRNEGEKGKREADVPSGWLFARLDALANPQAGFAFKSGSFNEENAGFPLIRIRDVGQPFTGTYYSGEFRDEFLVAEGDYIISMDGEFRVATWPGPDALLNQRVTRLQFYSTEIAQPFVALALGLQLKKLQGVKAYTTVDHLSGKQIAEARIPLPPLAEQRRIVARVDALMALCDALERESADALAAHQTLVEALLATLVASPDAATLATEWARLERCFDTLFTTEASVDALQATVLELAVRGKLVQQEASEAHSPLVAKLTNKQVKSRITLPTGWLCLPLSMLGRQLGGGTPSKSRSEFWNGSTPWVSPKDMKQDYIADAQMHVTEAALSNSPVKLVPPGSLLFVVRGMILDHSFPVALTTVPVTINQDMKAIVLHDYCMREYLLRALKGIKRDVLRAVERSSHGTCRLDAEVYASLAVPLPPLAEQHRIVAKVDELTALCDALKARIADAAVTARHLADAVVERAGG